MNARRDSTDNSTNEPLFSVSFLFQLHTDLDVGNTKIKYVLAGEGAGTIFAINELTGDIHAMKRLDREEKAEYTLTAQVINAETDEPLEPPSEFIIKVQDINDNPPQFIEGPYRASVPEMSAVGESHRDTAAAFCRIISATSNRCSMQITCERVNPDLHVGL